MKAWHVNQEDIMNIFDIVGPVMVGPSSSHTAGAVKIGYVSRKLLGEEVKEARILLYGSFLTTGTGHGTRKALVAGLLGMKTDDIRIPDAIELAEKAGMKIEFGEAHLKEAHPNTAQLFLTGVSGRTLEIIGQSLGGSRINIAEIDGIETNFSGEYAGCSQSGSAGTCFGGHIHACPQGGKYSLYAALPFKPWRRSSNGC
jgi:L-serine dehydratase